MTNEQLLTEMRQALARREDDFYSPDEASILDEITHDAANDAASAANNGGLEAQVEFLLAHGYAPEEILDQWRSML